MKLSIIIPVLNSHEIVKRQFLHFSNIDLTDVEVILVDDGSSPPIQSLIKILSVNIDKHIENIKVIETNDYRSWTQPKARNIGASYAKGNILIFTDIDHIITEQAINFGKNFKYDYGRFQRELGILTEKGKLSQAPDELIKFGLPKEKAKTDLHIGCHVLSMFIKKDIFNKIGGFRENLLSYPTHDDGDMKRKLNKIENIKKCPDEERPLIYMFPNGRYCGNKNCNPLGFFHNLKRVA